MKNGYGYSYSMLSRLDVFSPIILPNLAYYGDTEDEAYINGYLAADFVSANDESLSSTSTDFNFGDEDFSFGCWVKFDNNGTTQPLIGKWNNGSLNRSYLLRRGTSNEMVFFISNDGSALNSVTTGTLTSGTWYFVVGVYDSVNNLIKLSIDGGAFVTDLHTGGAYASSNEALYLALQNNSPSTGRIYADEQIDAPFIYSKALSLAEVKALYNSGNGIDVSVLDQLNGDTYSYATSFNGSTDAINIDAITTPLTATTQGTISAWVKATNVTPAGREVFWSFGDTNGDSFIFAGIEGSGGKIRFSLRRGGGKFVLETNSAAPITNGQWFHICCVQDAVAPVMYINGVEYSVAEGNASYIVSVNVTEWINAFSGAIDNARIGCYNYNLGGNTNFFNGDVDTVAIYSDAKSSAEVSTIYNAGNGQDYSAINKTNLVAFYSMDGVGDSTSNGYAGSYIGTPTIVTGKVESTIANIETSLVSWWTLNQDGGIRYDAVGTNDLTDNNTVGYATGKIQERVIQYYRNRSGSFNGSTDAVNVDAALTPLATTTTGTWSCWIKPVDGTPAIADGLIGFGDTTTGQLIDLALLTDGRILIQAVSGGTPQWRLQTDNVVASDNTWMHVATTYESGVAKIYINGVEEASTYTIATDKNVWFNDLPLIDNGRLACINFDSGGNTNFFDGDMDTVAIYSDVKDSTEIAAIYNSGSGQSYEAIDKTNLVAFYGFDDSNNLGADSNLLYDGSVIGTPTLAAGKVLEPILNEGDNVYTLIDKSPNADNLVQSIIASQPTWENGNVLYFNGTSDYLNADSLVDTLKTATVGTIACRIRFDDVVSASNYRFFSFAHPTNETNLTITLLTTGKIRVECRVVTTTKFILDTDAVVPVQDNEFMHLAIVQPADGNGVKIYINGSEVTWTASASGDLDAWWSALTGASTMYRIGCREYNSSPPVAYLAGAMAQMVITTSVLNAGQISQLYNYKLDQYTN